MRTLVSAVFLTLALTACGGGPDDPSNVGESETTDDDAHTPSPPEPEADGDGDGVPDSTDYYPENPEASDPLVVTVICDGQRFFIDRLTPDFTEAWSTKLDDPETDSEYYGGAECDYSVSSPHEPVSDREQVGWDGHIAQDEYQIAVPYVECVKHGTLWKRERWPEAGGHVEDAERALALCPNHPNAEAWRERIAEYHDDERKRDEGFIFGSGNHRVGVDVQPGRYYTEDVSDCYWERLDSAGEIIDNNFVSSGLRVEATIAASDYSFHTEGCGTWQPVG